MKRLRPWIVWLTLTMVIAAPLWAAAQSSSAAAGDHSPGAPVAAAVAGITGIAISPLLATAAYGAYQYYQTPELARDQLPWFAQMGFWVPALVLVGLVAAKDTVGALLPPGWKQPLDVLETVENKVSGVIAAGAVIPIAIWSMWQSMTAVDPATPIGAWTQASGLAMLGPVAALEGSTLLQWLTVPFAVAVYAVVWMAAHAINVLILLSPWGGIDAVLKLIRLGVLSLVALTTWINPWLGAAFSVVVIVFAYFIAGWAHRLTIFGTLFVWDFLSRARRRKRVQGDGDVVFSARRLPGVPQRTYGRLRRGADGLTFAYRRWWAGPWREVPMPAASTLMVARGVFFAQLQSSEGNVALLLPRYEGHEDELVRAYGLAGIRDAGLRRAWGWLREALGGSPPALASAARTG